MKVKCPWCGAAGTDVEPYPEHLRGPEWTPTKGEEDYAFEVRGKYKVQQEEELEDLRRRREEVGRRYRDEEQ